MESSIKQLMNIRRIFPNEVDYIKDIQDEVTGSSNFKRFDTHYLNHSAWVKKTIIEIQLGKKVAFGAFLTKSKTDHSIGSVIIKKGLSGEIEIKNLLSYPENLDLIFGLNPEKENDRKKNFEIGLEIKSQLIEKVEIFCVEKGYRKLIYEVPATDVSDVNFLINKNFKLLTAFESKYRRHDHFYIFSKDLLHSYAGDPFDYDKITDQLLSDFFQFKKVGSLESVSINAKSIAFKKKFIIGIDDKHDHLDFNGELLVAIGVNKDISVDFEEIRRTFSETTNLKLVISDIDIINRKGKEIKILTWKDIESVFDFKRPLISSFYNLSEINGFLINISFKASLEIVRANQSKNFIAFTFDGTGRFLDKIALTKKDIKVFLYSPPEDSASVGGVWAVCVYKGLNHTTIEDMESDLSDYKGYVYLDKDLYTYNSSYNNGQNLIGLEVSLIRLLKEPEDIENCISEKILRIIKNNEYDIGYSNTYLDTQSTDAILKKVERGDEDSPDEANLNKPFYT